MVPDRMQSTCQEKLETCGVFAARIFWRLKLIWLPTSKNRRSSTDGMGVQRAVLVYKGTLLDRCNR